MCKGCFGVVVSNQKVAGLSNVNSELYATTIVPKTYVAPKGLSL